MKKLLTNLIETIRGKRKSDWHETADAISNSIGVDISGGRLSDEEYAIQCYDDICDALAILSFEVETYSDNGRIIAEDVWNAANHASSLTPYRRYGELIPDSHNLTIHKLFLDVLNHPTPWRNEDFVNDDFWITIRLRSVNLIKELGIEERKFRGYLT